MINVALLGFGRIGQMHAENINKNKDLRLLYVYEKVDQLSKKAKHLYNCKIQTNYNKIFSDKDVDIIFISSPTNTHIKFIKMAAFAGKPVFCEKPIDLDINRVNECKKEIQDIKTPIQIGFNRRFDLSHKKAQLARTNKEIGDLEMIIITSRDPAPPGLEYLNAAGGFFRDTTIHDFDLSRFILGDDPIVQVSAFGANLFDENSKIAKDFDLVYRPLEQQKIEKVDHF